jgi:hypothetical protein
MAYRVSLAVPAEADAFPEAKELGFPARRLLYGKGKGVIESSFTSGRTSSMHHPAFSAKQNNVDLFDASRPAEGTFTKLILDAS